MTQEANILAYSSSKVMIKKKRKIGTRIPWSMSPVGRARLGVHLCTLGRQTGRAMYVYEHLIHSQRTVKVTHFYNIIPRSICF